MTFKVGGRKPESSGRKKGGCDAKTLAVREMINKICGDPLQGMAHIASGDVVKLGYMTVKELKEPPQFDARGRVVRMSGAERALMYVPVELRSRMFKELAEYCYCKKKAIVIEDEDGNNVVGNGMGVMLYMPHNGRDEPSSKVVIRKRKEVLST